MDMSGMGGMSGMSGKGGMDMGSSGLYKATNMAIARGVWCAVAALVLVTACERLYSYVRTRMALSKAADRSHVPSRPRNAFSQAHETLLTMLHTPFEREDPSAPVSSASGQLPVTSCLLGNDSHDAVDKHNPYPSSPDYAYKWEKVGFRAAWVSVTQLPLIYCLGSKFNVISLLTGISYDQLKWLHAWVARTMFLTVIVHWSFFFTEWSIADFVKYELQMMPMVKYGFGAWGVLGWTVLVSFGFFRRMAYELWVLQHLASAGLLLWLLYIHIPSYARYNIWLSIGFVALDRGFRGLWSIAHNFHISSLRNRKARAGFFGFPADAIALANGYVHLRIRDINFSWKPGQHIFVNIPTCGIFESHPFTIATNGSLSSSHEDSERRSIDIYLKCHSGFTIKLFRKAHLHSKSILKTRALLSRPYGTPPLDSIQRCNSLILIASSTGASFTVPLLEQAMKHAPFVQRVCFIWIVRHLQQLSWFHRQIAAAIDKSEELGLDFQVKLFVTRKEAPEQSSCGSDSGSTRSHDKSEQLRDWEERSSLSDVDSETGLSIEKTPSSDSRASELRQQDSAAAENRPNGATKIGSQSHKVVINTGRPSSWDDLIHPIIMEAEGETAIVACGAQGLMTDIRNYIAKLSDERAVHKGTGAQGIFLFTETYGW